MTADTVTTIGGTLVQHGRLSDRIYVMHLAPGDLPGILDDLDWLAEAEATRKFVQKCCFHVPLFLARGYVVEARVPRFFRGREDGYFAAKFLDAERRREKSIPPRFSRPSARRPAMRDRPSSRLDGRVPRYRRRRRRPYRALPGSLCDLSVSDR